MYSFRVLFLFLFLCSFLYWLLSYIKGLYISPIHLSYSIFEIKMPSLKHQSQSLADEWKVQYSNNSSKEFPSKKTQKKTKNKQAKYRHHDLRGNPLNARGKNHGITLKSFHYQIKYQVTIILCQENIITIITSYL